MESRVERVWTAFKSGEPVYGLYYGPTTRILERLQLIEETKTIYRCKFEMWVFDQKKNTLLSKKEGVKPIKKRKLSIHLYDLSLEEVIRARIAEIRSNIDFLENVKIPELKKEIEVLEKYLSGEYLTFKKKEVGGGGDK